MLCDGMADEPNEKLGGKTPMMLAKKPNIDALASKGEVGLVKTVQDGMKPGSDVANLSVLGYNTYDCYTGRSPLEAASIGIDLKNTDVTLRCNLVTLSDEKKYEDKKMVDYCGGDISTPEAKELVEFLEKKLGNEEFKFYAGVAYRHCLVWDKGNPHPGNFTPPHDIPGKVIKDYIPKGEDTKKLYELMMKSYDLLKDHPVNKKRVAEGKRPANSCWFWGEGTKPVLESFEEKTGLKGSMISAVDLLKGIAICAKMKSIDVEGATGYIDTNFEGKCQAAIDEFKKGQDFVYVHVEAPDECGHRAEAENKVKAIELIDEKILGPVVQYLKNSDDFAVLICPDHPTPLNIQTHSSNPVPYVIYDSKNEKESSVASVNEETAKATGNYIEKGYTMMDYFLSK